ncbi:SprT-like family-domain-containing protein, partial [Scenedesmus sp. NREL 46B-D3]
RQRQQLSQQLYDQWNTQVFDGGLPPVPLVWNPRLTSTAGQVVDDGSQNRLKASSEERVPVRLELSTKVLDCEARLRTTLAHEMCHVAAWAVSGEFRQHHGAAFWAWARRFEARVPGISVTTCHNYEVHAPFRWQCANNSCGKQYHRHKRSIDPAKHVCSRCNGRLMYLGKFSRDGKLVSSAAAAATPGGTPGGNAFSQFVKTHFAQTKRELPTGTPHKELMSRLAADYKLHKSSQQQQQLGEVLDKESRVEVVEVLSSEDEAGSSGVPPQGGRGASADQQGVEGLLSFLHRLDLAETD